MFADNNHVHVSRHKMSLRVTSYNCRQLPVTSTEVIAATTAWCCVFLRLRQTPHLRRSTPASTLVRMRRRPLLPPSLTWMCRLPVRGWTSWHRKATPKNLDCGKCFSSSNISGNRFSKDWLLGHRMKMSARLRNKNSVFTTVFDFSKDLSARFLSLFYSVVKS